jgi:hypothetical protein
LLYYEKSESFIIELNEELDEWEAPLLFQRLVREKKYTVPRDVSLMWVKERVIPSGRQNIGSILRNHKLKDYSEMALLRLSRGRCSQDNCYIEEIELERIPDDIRERMKKNLWECFPTEDNQLVCLFRDDVVKKVELLQLIKQYKELSHVLNDRKLLDSVKIGVGGYSVVFNDSIEIHVSDLRAMGQTLPLKSGDFCHFVSRNVLDTTQTCDMLQCSRQNVSYLVKEKKITPIIYGTKENLYLKGEVEKVMDE